MRLSKQERKKIKNLWKAVYNFLNIESNNTERIFCLKLSAKAFNVDILDIEMMLDELGEFTKYFIK